MHWADVLIIKLGYFKRNWISIITPIVNKQGCDVRMNLRLARIEIKPKPTEDEITEGEHNAMRSVEYIKAILSGFNVEDAKFLLNNKSTRLINFNIDDCKKYERKSKNRAIGRLIGTKGITKKNIERNLSIKIRDSDFYLIGTPTYLTLARSFISKLIKGSSQSSIHSKMSAIGERMKSNLF